MTTVKFRGSWYYTYQKVFNPLSTTRFWQKHLPNYLIFCFWYKISITGVDLIFVTFSIFEIDCNWTNVFFAKFKICRHIRMHGRQGVHDKKKKGNLHRNRRKTTNDALKKRFCPYSNIIVGEMPDRTQRFCSLSLSFCNNGILFASLGTQAYVLGLLWPWMVQDIFACFTYLWERLLYIRIKLKSQ